MKGQNSFPPMNLGKSFLFRNGVLSLGGYGIRIGVESGHLAIEDGLGSERRSGRFSRVARNLKRVIVTGHSGIISFEALRWIQDIGAAFIQIDTDGRVIAASTPTGLNDARLRRAQALASTNGVGLEVVRDLIRRKLEEQSKLLQFLLVPGKDFFEIPDLAQGLGLAECKSPQEFLRVERQAAVTYWSAWRELPVRFESQDAKRVPDHWLIFGQRHSLLSTPSPRRAINPPNAILNYLYAILEAEARIASLRMGLDPGLGFLHADQESRDSLPCDLMEPVRPKVDRFVLELLRNRTFRKSDFFETRERICRLMPPLTHTLAETAMHWAKEIAPVTEHVARKLFASARDSAKMNRTMKAEPTKSERLPTPLTESNRSAGRNPYRRKPEAKTVEEMRAWLFQPPRR